MNLPGDYGSDIKNFKRGISLLEIVIAISIFIVLAVSFVPLTTKFFRKQQFDIHSQGIVQALRRAQFKAMSLDYDSSFGVYFGEQEYILFKGGSYSERDQGHDEEFDLPQGAQISGITEIVFSKLEGFPSDTGNIYFTIGSNSKIIEVNNRGVINY